MVGHAIILMIRQGAGSQRSNEKIPRHFRFSPPRTFLRYCISENVQDFCREMDIFETGNGESGMGNGLGNL